MKSINESMTQEERAELFGCLIDVVEDWLEDKGFTPKDFPNDDRSFPMNPDEAIIFGEDYDRLANDFARVIGISRYCPEEINNNRLENKKKSWAEREVELACKKENPDRKDGEWDYGCACYESALKAYNSLCEDGHSGMSIGFTKCILNRLIDNKPLTPIEDTDDTWHFRYNLCGTKTYKSNRMRSLFKKVYADGTVKYNDLNRAIKVVKDENEYESTWHNRLSNDIVNEMFPITMPYMPEDNPYRVYSKEFLTGEAYGDYYTVGFFYLITPDGTRIDVNRYFGEVNGKMEEIDEKTYLEREEMSKRRDCLE